MTTDDLLAELATLGWLLNNCYQTSRSTFRVNIRRPTLDGNWFTDWAEADTFPDALAECMSKLLDAEFVADEPAIAVAESPRRSLLDALGLRPPSAPIVRRF